MLISSGQIACTVASAPRTCFRSFYLLEMLRLPIVLLLSGASAYVLPSASLRSSVTSARALRTVMNEAPTVDIAQTAQAAMDNFLNMLPDDEEPPQSLIDLKAAVMDGDSMDIGAKIYLLLVDQCLGYDIVEGGVVKTQSDFSNLDDPEVKNKMAYIYTYGISMFKKGLVSEDALKDAILNKVAAKVGMDGPEFDKWLEIPAVE